MDYTDREKELLDIIRSLFIERAQYASALYRIGQILINSNDKVVKRQENISMNENDIVAILETKFGAKITVAEISGQNFMRIDFPFDEELDED